MRDISVKRFIFCCAIFCLAFSAQGCVDSARSDQIGSSAYKLTMSVTGDSVKVALTNTSDHALASYGWFRAPGSGSAGLYLLFRNENGQQYHLCAQIDQALGGGQLAPHTSIVTKIAISELKNEYCLGSGVYILRATYAVPRPSEAPKIVAIAAPISVIVK